MPKLTRHRIALYTLVFLSFVLRTYRIDTVSLRGDEAFSMLNWTGPLKIVLRDIAPIDPQPPLAFVGLSAWVKLTGTSVFAARFYSALWSVLTIAPIYQIGKRLVDRRVGLLAALLWTVSPFQIWHAQDIRAYTLWPAFSILAAWLLLLSLESRSFRHRAAYVLATTAAAYSFYTEGLILVFHNLYAVWYLRPNRKSLWPWIGAQVAIAALLAPWYLQAPRLASSGYSGTGPRLFGLAQVIRAIPNVLTTLAYGLTLPNIAPWQAIIATILISSTLAGIVLMAVKSQRHRYFLIGYTVIPLALLLLLSTAGGFYRPRYLNGAAAAYLIAIAVLLGWLFQLRHTIAKWSAGLLLLTFIGINGVALANYFYSPKYVKAPDWVSLTERLEATARPNDMIIRNAPDPAFDFYYDGNSNRATIPSRPHPPLAETTGQLESTLAATPRIWFVPTDHFFWDPDYQTATYLRDNLQLLADNVVGKFHIQRWARWNVSEEELVYKTDWQIADIAPIAGFDTIPILEADGTLHASPGDTITLIVFWQPSMNTDLSYTAFSHLIGPSKPDGSTLWSGQDHPPQYGRVSTTNWTSKSLVRDSFNLLIPDDAPDGEFTIHIGMYDPENGQRLPVLNSARQTQEDSIPLVTVNINR